MTKAKQKVFGIGVPKSGSNSLAKALQALDYKTVHFGNEQFGKQTDLPKKFLSNLENDRAALSGFGAYDAFLDSPIWWNFQRLARENKNAKFILTYRDPSACAFSWIRMNHYLKKSIFPKDSPQDYTSFFEMTKKHIDEVFNFFKHDTKRLLLLDQSDTDEKKWSHLCNFLEHDTPDQKFPHAFSHNGFME